MRIVTDAQGFFSKPSPSKTDSFVAQRASHKNEGMAKLPWSSCAVKLMQDRSMK
jgi:hypothetical protein